MNAENEFEKWWKENWKGPKNAITQRSIAFFAFQGALALGRKSGLEEAASVVDAECARVLSHQTGINTAMEQSINTNIRMTAVLLPGLSDAIRQRIEETI